MALSAYAIPTLNQVKNYLKLDTGVTTADTILETWIDATSLSIEQYCNRKFAVQSVTNEIYDGDGSDTLWLRYWPLTQLSTQSTPSDAQKLAAVQYRTDPDSSWTDIEDDVDHIFTDLNWPFIKLYETVFPAGERNIRLNYKAGYSPVPGDVLIVAIEMAAMMWKESSQSNDARLGLANSSYQGFNNGFLDMNSRWRTILDRYKLPGGVTLLNQSQITR